MRLQIQAAEQSYHKAHFAAESLTVAGRQPLFSAPYFHEWVVEVPEPAAAVNERLRRQGMIGGLDLEPHYPELAGCLLFCCTEKRSRAEIDAFCKGVAG
jgi:glycine dehydrogenase subunit 1